MSDRLPAHIEVNGLVRRVNASGGFATVLHKGEPDAGSLLIVLTNYHSPARLFERMPTADGGRAWTCTRTLDPDKPNDFNDYLGRRQQQDRDTWIVELDVADGERFIL